MGQTNRDEVAHYGVISLHALAHWAIEEFETIYSQNCPSCGNDLDEDWEEMTDCPHCGEEIGDGDQYGDSPDCYVYDNDGLRMQMSGDDNDIFVTKSPVVINAQFCSPCAPGAGHLENPCDEGPITYAVPTDWFDEDSPCPYVTRLAK